MVSKRGKQFVNLCKGAHNFNQVIGKRVTVGAEDIVILPASVHECILLPLTDAMDTYYLRSMVREVNVTNVEPEDRLSENVYLYSRTSDEISILTE